MSAMSLPSYLKPHATAAQWLAHLQAKGLNISQPAAAAAAAAKIELIGYERLRIYILSRRQLTATGRPFLPGTSYEDIIDLYACDTALRDACFPAVGRFEILFRNAISETLSHRHGAHPYFEPGAFRDAAANIEAIRIFSDVYQRSRDQRAKHYRAAYGQPILPPVWVLKEFLTFGASSRIYQSLSGPIRTGIAAGFGVGSDRVFTSWVECLVDLRNVCAHHDRLFNRNLQKQPMMLRSTSLPTAPMQKLKAILECLDYLLNRRGSPESITAAAEAIIRRHPAVRPAEAGF